MIRLVNLSSRQQSSIVLLVLELHGKDWKADAIVTAEADHLRIRPLDNPEE
jgi:predicted nuclease of predicted toxin-antitoxin system